MSIYKYIAENNTDNAVELAQQNGYHITTINDLEDSLRNILAQSEEKAKEVLNLHPDRDILLEIIKGESAPVVVAPVVTETKAPETKDCGCTKNAEGDMQASTSSNVANQTNTYILVGALIVSLAIISMNK
jgi:hypothetical protein